MIFKSFMLIVALVAVPLCSQAQQRNDPDVPLPTKATAQRVAQIIKGDKVKLRKYCDLIAIGLKIEQAEKRKDTAQVEQLFAKAIELEKMLGPEYGALMAGLEQLEQLGPSTEMQEIAVVLEGLERLCPKK